MPRLRSRTQACVNGFWFRQAQTNWELQTWDFEALAQAVQSHRLANPRHNLTTDLTAIRNEVDEYNARRMQSIRGADIYIQESGPPPPSFITPPQKGRALTNVVGGAKHVAAGIGTLLDWLGSGALPVLNELSNARAHVCVECPKNQPGDIFAIFTAPLAEKLRTQLAIRRDMSLTTPDDAQLKICSACHCPLQLKVHVPLDHIESHLAEEVKERLDPRCWILKELHARNG